MQICPSLESIVISRHRRLRGFQTYFNQASFPLQVSYPDILFPMLTGFYQDLSVMLFCREEAKCSHCHFFLPGTQHSRHNISHTDFLNPSCTQCPTLACQPPLSNLFNINTNAKLIPKTLIQIPALPWTTDQIIILSLNLFLHRYYYQNKMSHHPTHTCLIAYGNEVLPPSPPPPPPPPGSHRSRGTYAHSP